MGFMLSADRLRLALLSLLIHIYKWYDHLDLNKQTVQNDGTVSRHPLQALVDISRFL